MMSRGVLGTLAGLLLVLVLYGCATGRDSDQDSVLLRQMAPPHERGIKSIALLYRRFPWAGFINDRQSHGAGYYTYGALEALIGGVASFIDAANTSWVHAYAIEAARVIPDDLVMKQFLAARARAPYVRLEQLTTAEARLAEHVIDHENFNLPRGFDEAGKEVLADLKARGIDALILVDERQRVLTPGGVMPTKGIYRVHDVARAVAGFRFSLIDTATGEEIENSGYVQTSDARIELPYWALYDDFSPFEKLEIKTGLEARVADNVQVMLRLLKVVPEPNGEFLSVDPAEPPQPSPYPE